MNDVDIIKEILVGKSYLFEEIVARYKKLVYKVIYGLVRNKEQVEDIAQEVFIKVYKNLHRYNKEYKFSTWISRITSNTCMDYLRKKKIISVPIEEAYSLSDSTLTPEGEYIKKEVKFELEVLLKDMEDKYRVPLLLYHKSGLKYKEISEMLDVPMSIVKNRIFRARGILKKQIEEIRKEEQIWNV